MGHAESMDAITQNLANCSTPGYRKLDVSHKVFDALVSDSLKSSKNNETGRTFDPVVVDFTQGPLQPTERPLDCALRGDGFFVVSKDGKDYYTRKGDFHKDNDGRLLTSDGAEVQGEGGGIQIPQNAVVNSILVSDDGTVHIDKQIIGKLKIAEFEDPSKLLRAGDTLFAAPDDVEPTGDTANTQVSNRTLEHSNTSVSEEMADLIKTMRNYQACQKMIRNYDENTGRMIQQFST